MAKSKITYLKLLQNIKLNDGTVIDKGTSIKMNFQEGPFYNVELLENKNVKKIFWITEDQARISVTRNQNWNKKMQEDHIRDIEETWLDNIKKGESSSLKKNTNSEPVVQKSIKKRGRPKKNN